MISGLRVREATNADLPAIKQLVDTHRNELGFVPRPALTRSIDRGWLLVADLNDTLVGMINWWARKDESVVLYNLVVSPSIRRQGIGARLLEELIYWAQSQGKRRLVLKCPADLPSNDFYARFGFSLLSREPGKHRPLNLWSMDLTPRAEH